MRFDGRRVEGHLPLPGGGGDTTVVASPRPAPAAPQVRVEVVRGFRVVVDGRVLGPRDLGGTKQRQVLLVLLLAHGAPLSKATLVDVLWGATPPAGAVAALESHVSVLRSRLGGREGRRLVVTVPHGYVLPRGAVRSDLDDAHELLRRSAGLPAEEELALLQEALQLLDGTLLPEERASAWLDDARAEHDARVSALRTRLARAAGLAGQWEKALRWAGDSVRRDPIDEAAWEVVVRAHLALGHPVEALRAFDRCRDVLRSQLGCAPGAGLQSVLDDVLAATEPTDDDLAELLHAVLVLRRRTAVTPPEQRRRVLLAARQALAALAVPG
ncbi:AfsR/SARP family transcriptional regulator [Aquipuribacter nitratireducens]|uniref:BTAD domain-containing putative transcriptional regulator n=1 Tax=Aquipuribacter nitratireducens TaxID=650104 RepID=A0ABW0GNB4_9MICO